MDLTLEQALEQAEILKAGLAEAATRGITPSMREATILALARGVTELLGCRDADAVPRGQRPSWTPRSGG